MQDIDENRRGLLAALAGLTAAAGGLLPATAFAQAAVRTGYHLGAAEGETIVRPSGDIVVKVDPTKGSPSLAMGTQHLKVGAGIPVHRHVVMDEILLVQDGRGFAMLDDQRTPIAKGSTIFVPKGFWHGFENPEGPMDLIWIVSPPGLEAFFREIGSAPGAPPKSLTREQFRAIGEKYGTIFKA
jgi:quercetin dioxygenase-like cupin family protein